MDVLKFINSKSIAKHLQAIGYEFNALEASFIVWQSKLTTMDEKFEAWEQIITDMPDMAVSKRPYGWETDEPSLHAFLRRYIDAVKSVISKFYECDNAVFSFEWLEEGYDDWCNDYAVYSSFDACKNAIDKEMSDNSILLYSITKREIDGSEKVELVFNANGGLMDIYANQDKDDDSPCLLDYFDGLWFKFPTPFKRGDIVYRRDRRVALGNEKPNPFVLIDMWTWDGKKLRENGYIDEEKIARCEKLISRHSKDGDTSDMQVFGHFVDDSGRMHTEHTWGALLDLEYYDGKLDKDKMFLMALSNHEKGEIGIELLLNSYLYFTNSLRNDYIEKHTFCAYLDK